jgi:hypothetical protein
MLHRTDHRLLAAAAVLIASTSMACGDKTPTSPSPSQPTPTYVVSGTVRDAGNLNLLSQVRIQLTASTGSSEVVTDFDGRFSFSGVSGSATLTAAASGYETQSVSASVAAPAVFDLQLKRVAGRAVGCGDAPDTGNRILPIFSRPFHGEFLLSNYFDHDLPLGTYAGNGYQHTYCDERVTGRLDTHQGYDWLLPTGTPLLAVSDGEVISAGVDAPFFCATLGRTVSDQQFVEIRHPVTKGEQFSSVFVHLSRIDVSIGQMVTRGQVVGVSGNTGCSTEPHLHLQVWRFTHTNEGRPALADPYGWEGAGPDPWAQHPSGSSSVWLWLPREAPPLHLR